MNKSDFYFELPQELIAQTPLAQRDHSRLMVLDRKNQSISHRHFYDIADYLNPGDLLVLNDSRVIPARLYGHKEPNGGAVEFLLLKPLSQNVWEILTRPGKKAKPGARFVFGDGLLHAEILEVTEGGNRIAQFFCEENLYAVLDQIGRMPLPPYITAELKDNDRYQTVYAREKGSAAAPTAGLHFTPELLQSLTDKGVEIAYVTLHVGLGTFRPVKEDDILKHKMHTEHYHLPAKTAAKINTAKQNGKRVIAVGTTSCRTLETVAAQNGGGAFFEAEGDTGIFIYPGVPLRAIDGMITNFHLPESTLIMLVSAFCGKEFVLRAYHEAVCERYRFFSFGDAMLLL